MTEEYFKKAKNQWIELNTILKNAGILDLTNKEDFISKVWGIANYTPRKIDNDLIDIDFKNITATLHFYDEKPVLIPEVEFFVGGNSEDWFEFYFD